MTRPLRFATVPGDDSEDVEVGKPDLACSVVTSSSLLPHNFVPLFLSTTVAELFDASNLDERSILRLCSAATTLILFLCLKRCCCCCCGVYCWGGGESICSVVGDVPPDGVSMTGLSRSCSGKYSSSRSYTSSGGGRGAHV